jgi:beta-mannosidase
MSRRILDLGTLHWQFGSAPRQPYGAAPGDDRGQVREWLPAKVPGDVRADLVAAGRIPPVETPEGIAAGAWVDDWDWWYRAELPKVGQFANLPYLVVLEADGIDYYSATWLDDRLLATHAGMFARQTVILPPALADPGPHELAIRIWGGSSLPALPNSPVRCALRWLFRKLSPGFEYFPNRMATPKAQFSFGWDFSPRLLSTGIWDGLRLVAARSAYIQDLWVRAEPLSDRDPTPARWRLRLRVHGRQAQPMRAEVIVRREGAQTGSDGESTDWLEAPAYVADVQLRETGGDDFDLEFMTPSVRLWWPWDQGEPCLYRVTARLVDETGPVDEISRVTGVRTVVRTKLPDGSPWRFTVNARPLFLRGANWVPADVLPGRVRLEDYACLLAQARDAGINFLRVWGGGVREKAGFWETCDRLGIMAWQEFPLACAFFDHYPREQSYLETLSSEACGIVRALRHHPSLIAWGGGNEINPRRERMPLGAIEEVLRREDPDRPWIPASPSDGEVHQWQVWHGYAPWTELAKTESPFMSEFGLQALPDADTLREMFEGAPPTPWADPRWGQRKAQVDKLRHYAGPGAQGCELAAAIEATQRVQAAALQAGIEASRIRRDAAGGVAFWQFNEPWPAVSWSVIDRRGRPKAAYGMLCRSFRPVLIAVRFLHRARLPDEVWRGEIWLVNDGPLGWSGCRAEAILEGVLLWKGEGLPLPGASAVRAGGLTWASASPQGVLRLRLLRGEVELASNSYDLDVPLLGPGPRMSRWRQALAARLLRTG